MNFTDDLEENISILIKWLMLISLVVIILWGLTNLFKSMFDKEEPAKVATSTEMVNDGQISNGESNVEEELQDRSLEEPEDVTVTLSDDNATVKRVGDKTFKLNIKEIPDELYYGLRTLNAALDNKQEIIKQKVGENYMDSVLSYGTLERWNPASFPLKVYIKYNPNVPRTHVNELKSAFAKWQERTNDFISFVFVQNEEQADIVCSYPEDFNRTCEAAESSTTSRQYFSYNESGQIDKAQIELTYRDCNGERYADDLVYAFTLKEVGHALGLRGHSGRFDGKALYYSKYVPGSPRAEINAADINTLKLVYSVMPDKTNASFTDEQSKKLIKPEEVWGDKVQRTPSSEKAILYNIEKTPNIPDLHISLANYYSDKGEYDKALEVYYRSIVLLQEADMKARVYVRVADTFTSQSRYMEAAEAYKMSLKNLNKKQTLFDVYFNLGYIYYQQGKYAEALGACQSAIQHAFSKETFYKLLMNLTLIYLKDDNTENAQKCAEKALSFFVTQESQYLVAYIKYLNEDYVGAQELLQKIIGEYDYALAYGLLAQIYFKNQEFDALKALSDEASEVFPTNTPFVFQ